MQIVYVLTQVLVGHPLLAPSLLQERGPTPLLAFTGTDGVTTTPFLTHSHPFN